MVTYKILCKSDYNVEITLEQLLKNEKIVKAIKSEFAKGIRNIDINAKDLNSLLKIETQKEHYQFEARKDDFADLISLAEEDANVRKLFKKDSVGVELLDIQTVD